MTSAAVAIGCARRAATDTAPTLSSSAGPLATGAVAASPARAGGSSGSADYADFATEARTLYRIAACGGPDKVPAGFDAAVVERHCDELGHAYDEYRTTWVDVVEAFFSTHRPEDVPRAVVYPFGGGDLAGALATFPGATEITTISLEPAGDVRAVDGFAPDRLGRELSAHRSHLERLFEGAYSRTDSLHESSSASLPGEIIFALAALVIHRAEPVSLRYFRLEPDGAVAYVGQADIAGASRDPVASRELFANAELGFRMAGDSPQSIRTLRHIAQDLDDPHLRASPGLLAHLDRKGTVSAMTKAASHLLWRDDFSLIRAWLLAHASWMASDTTGFPPRAAAQAGFAQDTYGKYEAPGPWGLPTSPVAGDFERLFASEPAREIRFRFGYPDKYGHANLVVSRR
jgi:hypothetical protein